MTADWDARPRALLVALTATIGLGIGLGTDAQADEIEVGSPPLHEYLVPHLDGFFREGDEFIEPSFASLEPRGPAGRALKEFRFNEGLRRTFFSFDRSRTVIVEIRDFKGSSDSFLLRGADWDPADIIHQHDRGTLIHYESPSPDHLGRLERGMVSRFRIEVAVLVESGIYASDEAARRALDTLADDVAEEQFTLVPELDDVPNPLNDSRLRTVFRATSALILPAVYVLLWLGNSSRRLGRRVWISAGRSAWIAETDELVGVDVSCRAQRARRTARLVSATAAVGLLIGTAASWPMGAGDKAVQLGLWLAGLVVARRYLFRDRNFRQNYRASLGAIGRVRGAAGLAVLFGLLWAGLWLIEAALAGYLFGMAPAEHMAIDPTGAMTLRFGQLLAVLGVLALALIPLAYRRMQGAARRRIRSVVELDDRPPVLYLRSFADDQKKVRAKRAARHSLFEYLRPGAWDRFDEVVAWSLWRRGPVVAIGEPGRPVTAMGAAREYYTTDDWQGAVARHASAAPVIAVTVGTSDGVTWELEHLRSRGHLERTIFILPPSSVADTLARLELLHRLVLDGVSSSALEHLAELPVLALRIGEIGEPIIYIGDEMDASAYIAALEQAADDITRDPPGDLDDCVDMTTRTPPRPNTSKLMWLIPLGVTLVMLLPVWMLGAIPDEEDTQPPSIPLAEGGSLPTCPGAQHVSISRGPIQVLSVCPRSGVAASTDESGSMETLELSRSIHSVVPLDDGRVVVGDLRSPVVYELSIEPLELIETHEVLDAPSSSLAIVGDELYAAHPSTRTATVLSHDLVVEQVLNLDSVPRAIVDGGVEGPLLLASFPPSVTALAPEDEAQLLLTDQVAAPRATAMLAENTFVADPGKRRVLRLDESGESTYVDKVEVTDVLAFDGGIAVATFDAVSGYSTDGQLLWQHLATYPILVPFGDDGLAFTDQDSAHEDPYRLRIFEPR